jgi:hypothetical protein
LPGSYKNIITWLVKILIGLGSFAIIYWRLKDSFTPENLEALSNSFSGSFSYCLIIISVLLIPVNWGIESYKWKLITRSVETISFKTAMKSVYAGVCVGNLAPGRATEFLAKILFFKQENRPTIALLHFANGMFQLSVTIIAGIIGLLLKCDSACGFSSNQFTLMIILCVLLLGVFALFIFKFELFQKFLMKILKRHVTENTIPFSFSKKLSLTLFAFSILRYVVFTTQFILAFKFFYNGFGSESMALASVFVYFLFTTALPMISVVEPAIRTAIALIVFKGAGYPEISVAITAVFLWLINIAVPSIIGYIIILKEKFEFSSFKK